MWCLGLWWLGAWWLGPAALAQSTGSDVSISSVGVQTWTSSALFATDTDLALAQRLRWTVAGEQRSVSATRLLADARFNIDPSGGDPVFEWSAVRQAAVEVSRPGWWLTVGRTSVSQGGPRLVDGAQLLFRPSNKVDVGMWAGLAPDVFTTRPALRPGAGPVFAYAVPRVQFSVVGDVTTFVGDPARTGLDRVGVLTMARVAADRVAEVAGRADVELVGGAGTRLVDGSLVGVLTPTEVVRVDAVYNAFSSYLYQNTTDLDPDLRRFAARANILGTGLDAIEVDTRDPRLNHMVGGGVQLERRTAEFAPRLKVTVRNRFHEDPLNRYFRLNPQAGVARMGGALDLFVDGNYLRVPIDPDTAVTERDSRSQWDLGLVGLYFPKEGSVGLDGSIRYVNAPDQFAGRSFYADLYVDVVSEDLGLLVTAGGSLASEPDVGLVDPADLQADTGVGAYLRVSKYLRRK